MLANPAANAAAQQQQPVAPQPVAPQPAQPLLNVQVLPPPQPHMINRPQPQLIQTFRNTPVRIRTYVQNGETFVRVSIQDYN
jgi:hypothetical protein